MKLSFSKNRSSMITLIKAKLLLALTHVQKSPLIKSKIKNIIILRYDRIGDLIVSLPLIASVKERLPQSRVTVVASKINAPLAEISEFIDRTVVKETNFLFWTLQLLNLRLEKPDLVVDLNHSVAPHAIVAARILNAPHAATPYKDGRWGIKGSRLKLFDIMPGQHPRGYARPISETYLDILLSLGYQPKYGCPYPLPKFNKPNHLKKNYLILNPCGSRNAMHLQGADLLEIANCVALLRADYEVVIPAMADNYDYYSSLFSTSKNVTIAPPSPTIVPTLALVQHSRLVITPDTALVHIACAYSVKLIAVYTSDQSLFEQWKPLNRAETHVIRSNEQKTLKGYSSLKLLRALKTTLLNLNEKEIIPVRS